MADEEKELKPLSKKHQKFVAEYLLCFNGTEAYSRAYPKANRDSARANAAKLLANTSVSEEVQARLAELHMSADEALKLLADMARGDIGEYIDDRLMIDLSAARENGATRIIKKIRQRTITKIGKGDKDDDTEITDTEIELYSAKDAIDTILKVGGKLKDSEMTINVKLTDD